MNVNKRLIENLGIISEKEMSLIQEKRVLLVGCGGIGGNVANFLARLGVKHLTIIDFDAFDETNLNRQMFSDVSTIGTMKVDVLKKQLQLINPEIELVVHKQRIEDLGDEVYKNQDYIIDAVDQPRTKVFLNEVSTKYRLPLLHGACAGWYAQVGWIEPGVLLLKDLYEDKISGLEDDLRNASFTPALTAALMVSEFVKYVLDKSGKTVNRLILVDLLENTIISTGEWSNHG